MSLFTRKQKSKGWEEIKSDGSPHYKTGEVQIIDLLRDIKPHPSLTVLEVAGLFCDMKYAYRQLTQGISVSDCDKISHYTKMVGWRIKPQKRGLITP